MDGFARERAAMVKKQMQDRDISDPTVLAAMESVPRHEFVPVESRDQAYADWPLPIGYGQTISQPYIVALMTQLAQVEPGDKVLEVGTGSGYQAAVLAEITDSVYSVEIIPELAAAARERLDSLGYAKVVTAVRDGYYGWEEHAPYDAIIVTAAPDHVPPSLVEQLAEGGRLVIPVGPPGFFQTLWLIEKTPEGIKRSSLGSVAFVPLTGQH
ncbi:MAG: protein-L-isoaspartate(D-aspartate) O-methyltransferase [Anaerolineae bacterium]|nr:protein-L-isoaspartate(D-aspartate) O-methyltransferase [Anaerolineae bacterium]